MNSIQDLIGTAFSRLIVDFSMNVLNFPRVCVIATVGKDIRLGKEVGEGCVLLE